MLGLHHVAWKGRLPTKQSNEASNALGGIDELGEGSNAPSQSETSQLYRYALTKESRTFSGAISVAQWQEKLVQQELRHKIQLRKDQRSRRPKKNFKKAKFSVDSEREERRGKEGSQSLPDPALLQQDQDSQHRIIPFDLSVLPHINPDPDDPVVLHNMHASGAPPLNQGSLSDSTHIHEHIHEHCLSGLPSAKPETGWRGSLVNGHGTLSCQLNSTTHLHYHFHGNPKYSWEDEPKPEFYEAPKRITNLEGGSDIFLGEPEEPFQQDDEGDLVHLQEEQVVAASKNDRHNARFVDRDRPTATQFGGHRLGSLATALLNQKPVGHDVILSKQSSVVEEEEALDMSSSGSADLIEAPLQMPASDKSRRPHKLSLQESMVWKKRALVKEAHCKQRQTARQGIGKPSKLPVQNRASFGDGFGLGFKEIQKGCEQHFEQPRGPETQYLASECGNSPTRGFWILDEEALNALPDENLAPTIEYGRWEVPVVKDLSLCGKGKALRRRILEGLTIKKLQCFLGC